VTGTGGGAGARTQGVEVTNNGSITSTTGPVTVTGTGGGGGTSVGENYGVLVTAGGRIAGGGAGAVRVDGTGGTSGPRNHGVLLFGAGTVVTSGTGPVAVVGRGGPGGNAVGVIVQNGAVLTAGGLAPVTVEGTGGTTGSENRGVLAIFAGSRITTGGGDLRVTGRAGAGADSNFVQTLDNGVIAAGAPGRTEIIDATGTAPANRPPVAVADTAQTGFQTPVTVIVLANDSDPDGDPVTVTGVSVPSSGTAGVVNNQVVYTPAAGFSGTATFTYPVADGRGGTATAGVTVTVNPPVAGNRPPVAAADTAATAFQTPVTVNVLGNDSDPDGNPLAVAAVSAPSSGTATIVNNQVVFTPAAGFTGDATFTYTLADGRGGTATADVTVTVAPGGGPGGGAGTPLRVGYPQFAAGADRGGGPVVNLYNPDGSVRQALTVFAPNFTGGVRTAAADFNGDGVADIVAGTGPGVATLVRVLDGVTGAELFAVAPFESSFTGGVYVAAGDITGDGVPDLVITPDEGGGPRVRIFSGAGFAQVADFFGIADTAFRGGARAAVGDVNGDGVGDLAVAAGFGGGPRVSVLDGRSIAGGTPTQLFADFFAFEPGLRNGVYVALGDMDGDGRADLIAGGGPGGGPRVTVFSGANLLATGQPSATLANFFGGDVNNRGGIRVAVKNLDNDNRADLVVGAGAGAGSRVTGYLGREVPAQGTPPEALGLESFGGFGGGVFVG